MGGFQSSQKPTVNYLSRQQADQAYIDQAELDAYLKDYATQQYLQDYYTKTAADAAVTNALKGYQPAGEYVTTSALNSMKYASKNDLSNFASFKDVEESSTKLQDYLVKDYLPKTYQPAGNYALKTDIPSLSGYALKTDIPSLSGYALKTDIPSLSGYALKTDIPSLTNYLGKQDAVNLYQPKGNYALKTDIPSLSNYALKTDIPSLSGYAKTSDLSGFVKADTTSLTNYLGKKAAESLYQPRGNYLSADALNSGLTMNQWSITPSSEKLCFTKGNKVLGCIDSRGNYVSNDICGVYRDEDKNISIDCIKQMYDDYGCADFEQKKEIYSSGEYPTISKSKWRKMFKDSSISPSNPYECYGNNEDKWSNYNDNTDYCAMSDEENPSFECAYQIFKNAGCKNFNEYFINENRYKKIDAGWRGSFTDYNSPLTISELKEVAAQICANNTDFERPGWTIEAYIERQRGVQYLSYSNRGNEANNYEQIRVVQSNMPEGQSISLPVQEFINRKRQEQLNMYNFFIQNGKYPTRKQYFDKFGTYSIANKPTKESLERLLNPSSTYTPDDLFNNKDPDLAFGISSY
jgi:hypothetical protein